MNLRFIVRDDSKLDFNIKGEKMALPIMTIPVVAKLGLATKLGVGGVALYGMKKLYDAINDSFDDDDDDDDDEVENPLRDILHDITKYHLTGNDYARLCALANSDSDLSEADSAEYIALETKAKEPIFSALDKFNFADCFVALIKEKFSDYKLDDIKRFDKNDENLSIGIMFVALAFDDIVLKAVLRNELTGNQMKVVEQWGRFIDNLDMDIYEDDDEDEDNYTKISDIVRTDEMSNAKKMRSIRRILGESYEKTIADFEAMCGVVIEVIKGFLGQPLFELYRDSK